MAQVPLNWPTKTNYPPYCPGQGEPCGRGECEAAKEYSWWRVFLSIPYSSEYLPYRDALQRGLAEHGYLGSEARDDKSARPLSIPIYQCMCKSGRAIVDLSTVRGSNSFWPPRARTPAAGVLTENSFLRALFPAVLHVVRKGTRLPAELNALVYCDYSSPEQLEKVASDWIRELDDKYLGPLRRVLVGVGAVKRCHTWFHCFHPTARTEDQGDFVPEQWDRALSGGYSGHMTLVRAVNALAPEISFRRDNFSQCADVQDSREARSQLTGTNLYLLDSPVTRDPAGRAKALNWVMHYAMDLLASKHLLIPPLTVGMKVIPPDGPEAESHPGERVSLHYGGGDACYATYAWDYGFIVRSPSPFDREAFLLLMAGIHAPATHAAAEAVTDPCRMQRLMVKLKSNGMRDTEPCYFEAVFRVRRTYLPADLGQIEWVFARPLAERSGGARPA